MISQDVPIKVLRYVLVEPLKQISSLEGSYGLLSIFLSLTTCWPEAGSLKNTQGVGRGKSLPRRPWFRAPAPLPSCKREARGAHTAAALTGRLRFHRAAVQGKLQSEPGRKKPWFHSATQECASVWSGTLLSKNPAFLPIKLERYKYLKNLVGFVCLFS